MFDEIDEAYFNRRAQECRLQAEAATEPGIANIHRAMAREYEAKAMQSRWDHSLERRERHDPPVAHRGGVTA